MECDGFRLGTMYPHVEAERNKPEDGVTEGQFQERGMILDSTTEVSSSSSITATH